MSNLETLINLNNAGSSKPLPEVVTVQKEYLDLEVRLGGYEAANRSRDKIARTYSAVARLVGCSPREVAFMDSASRGWNTFLYSYPLNQGDVILSARGEFGTNLVSIAHRAAHSGARVVLAGHDESGQIDLDDFTRKLTPDVALVAISHIPMHVGVANPVKEIGGLIAEQGRAAYLLDACQSVGHVPIDIAEIGCHACVGTGRKWLRAPRGTGFLYVKEGPMDYVDPLTVDLATASIGENIEAVPSVKVIEGARRFETWERSIAAFIGLGVAAEKYVNDDPIQTWRAIAQRAERLRSGLRDQGYDIREPDASPIGIVSCRKDGLDAATIKDRLARQGFAVSTVQAYDAPIDFADARLDSLVRISPHAYNSLEDIEGLLKAMTEVGRG